MSEYKSKIFFSSFNEIEEGDELIVTHVKAESCGDNASDYTASLVVNRSVDGGNKEKFRVLEGSVSDSKNVGPFVEMHTFDVRNSYDDLLTFHHFSFLRGLYTWFIFIDHHEEKPISHKNRRTSHQGGSGGGYRY